MIIAARFESRTVHAFKITRISRYRGEAALQGRISYGVCCCSSAIARSRVCYSARAHPVDRHQAQPKSFPGQQDAFACIPFSRYASAVPAAIPNAFHATVMRYIALQYNNKNRTVRLKVLAARTTTQVRGLKVYEIRCIFRIFLCGAKCKVYSTRNLKVCNKT